MSCERAQGPQTRLSLATAQHDRDECDSPASNDLGQAKVSSGLAQDYLVADSDCLTSPAGKTEELEVGMLQIEEKVLADESLEVVICWLTRLDNADVFAGSYLRRRNYYFRRQVEHSPPLAHCLECSLGAIHLELEHAHHLPLWLDRSSPKSGL